MTQALPDLERRILEYICLVFRDEARWVSSRHLVLDLGRPGTDVYEVARDMQDLVIIQDPDREDALAKLTIEGVAACEGSEQDLQDFVSVVQLFVRRYRETRDGTPHVTTEDLERELGLSALQARRMGMLALEGHGLWRSAGQSTEGSARFGLDRRILRFEGIESIEDYFEVVRQSRSQPALARADGAEIESDEADVARPEPAPAHVPPPIPIDATVEHLESALGSLQEFVYMMFLSAFYEELHDRFHITGLTREIDEEMIALSYLWPNNGLQEHCDRLRQRVHEIDQAMLSSRDPDALIDAQGTFVDMQFAMYGAFRELIIEIIRQSSALASVMPFSPSAVRITYHDIRRNPQTAVQQAFTLFEDALREKTQHTANVYGQDLINRAFGRDRCLTYGDTPAEQAAVRDLMAGAYGLFRNPRMHRVVGDDERTAMAIVSLVDLMMQIVEEAERRPEENPNND